MRGTSFVYLFKNCWLEGLISLERQWHIPVHIFISFIQKIYRIVMICFFAIVWLFIFFTDVTFLMQCGI